MIHLNLFATATHDIEKLHRQRIITRAFLTCLLLALAILSFYQLIALQTKTITVPRPSQVEYERLYENYRATLRCACSQPFLSYSTFIQITPHLHQLCSSEIISPDWYRHLALFNVTGDFSNIFWPTFGSSYFQLLASFCSLVQTTIDDTYRVFSSNIYTSDLVMPHDLILAHAQEFSDLYIKSTEVETNRSFSFIRGTTYLNQFLTGTKTNFNIIIAATGEVRMTEGNLGELNPSNPGAYSGPCSCFTEGSRCGFYPFLATTVDELIFITSLIIKCFPIDSVLSSTLECWYNSECMTLVRDSYILIGVPDVINIGLLDTNIQSRFSINTTIEVMMQELFLENWTVTFSYDQYYKNCAPVSCTHTVEQRFDLFFVIVTVLAVYGGLSQGLRLVIPLLVRLLLVLVLGLRARNVGTVQPSSSMRIHQHFGKKEFAVPLIL